MAAVVGKTLRRNGELLWNVSREIWRHPELSFEEKFAHDLLTATLEDFGFDVQKRYFLQTAFRAEYDSGRDGPTIAAICEYDALPGIGHACGHNLIAEIGLGVGIAVKEAMENDPSIGGKIVVMGTPAEEGDGGKIKLLRHGAFDDIDAAIMAHPQSVNRLYPLIVESAIMRVKFTADPGCDPWAGASAVDAAVACYNNITLIRRRLKEKWRISMIIPTSSSEESTMEFNYRAQSQSEINAIKDILQNCIETAAKATDCTYKIDAIQDTKDTYKGLLYNEIMTELFGKHARDLGLKFYDKDPNFVESAVSSDIGNVSQVIPAMQPEFYIGAHAPDVNHTPGFADVAGCKEAQMYTLPVIEALAKTAVDLMSDQGLVEKMKEEFQTNPLKDPGAHMRRIGEI